MEGPKARRQNRLDAFNGSTIQQLLVSLVAIKIAGLVLIVDPAGLLSFELPKALFSRAVEWLIAGALLIAFMRHGPRVIPRTRLHFAVAAIILVTALSTLFAENRYIAVFGEEDHYLGLAFVADMSVLYLGVAVAFRRFGDWALLASILAFATALVLAYAGIQYIGLDPIGWNVDAQTYAFSTFGDADTFGRYLTLVVGMCVGVAVLGRGQVPLPARVVAALLAVAAIAGAALSVVTSTVIGITVMLGALPVVYLRMRGATRRALVLSVLALVVLASIPVALVAFTPVGVDAQRVIRGGEIRERLLLLDSAFHASIERPFLGFGPDNFAVAYPRFRQPGGTTVGNLEIDSHNWVGQTIATTGALGFLAVVAGIFLSMFAFWKILRQRDTVLGAALLLASLGYWVQASTTIASVSLDWFPYVALGAVATMGERWRLDEPPNRRATSFAIAIVAILAVAGSLTGIPAFLANRDIAIAAAEASTRPQVAVAAAESAVRRDPGRAVYWYWLGRAHDSQMEWSRAATAYAEAAARSPYERAYWGHMAQSLAQDAQHGGGASVAAAAIAAARRGTEVDPNEPLAHITLAEVMYALGDYDLSLRSAVDAIKLWPAGKNDLLVAQAAARATDLRQARALLEDALAVRDSADLHLVLARLALKSGDLETARAQAKRTLELTPSNAEAQQILTTTGR